MFGGFSSLTVVELSYETLEQGFKALLSILGAGWCACVDLQNRSCFNVNKIHDFCCHLKTDFGITPDFKGSLQHPSSCVHTRPLSAGALQEFCQAH